MHKDAPPKIRAGRRCAPMLSWKVISVNKQKEKLGDEPAVGQTVDILPSCLINLQIDRRK